MDFATVLSPTLQAFDWLMANGDLAADGGLDTGVAISLFSDRLANPDDAIPDGTDDRRGWCLDYLLPPLADGTPDYLGSRLWLLSRAVATLETAQNAQAYCEEALEWLVDDGVAAAVTVPLPTFPRPGFMQIVIIIAEQTAAGLVNRRYEILWDLTRATPSSFALILGGV